MCDDIATRDCYKEPYRHPVDIMISQIINCAKCFILKVLYVGIAELGIAVQIQNIGDVFFSPAPPPQT